VQDRRGWGHDEKKIKKNDTNHKTTVDQISDVGIHNASW